MAGAAVEQGRTAPPGALYHDEVFAIDGQDTHSQLACKGNVFICEKAYPSNDVDFVELGKLVELLALTDVIKESSTVKLDFDAYRFAVLQCTKVHALPLGD